MRLCSVFPPLSFCPNWHASVHSVGHICVALSCWENPTLWYTRSDATGGKQIHLRQKETNSVAKKANDPTRYLVFVYLLYWKPVRKRHPKIKDGSIVDRGRSEHWKPVRKRHLRGRVQSVVIVAQRHFYQELWSYHRNILRGTRRRRMELCNFALCRSPSLSLHYRIYLIM